MYCCCTFNCIVRIVKSEVMHKWTDEQMDGHLNKLMFIDRDVHHLVLTLACNITCSINAKKSRNEMKFCLCPIENFFFFQLNNYECQRH